MTTRTRQSRATTTELKRARVAGLPRSLTFAAVFDNKNREQEITDFMVRRACREAEKLQQFPFCSR